MSISLLPNHHPSDERLLDYVTGSLAEPIALVIASHLALCSRCRDEVQWLEAIGGVLLDESPPEALSSDCLDRALAQIERPEVRHHDEKPLSEAMINPDLPQPLRSYLDRSLDQLSWRKRGAISEIELLPAVDGYSTRLLRMRAGAAAPRHTHQGSELTLVLKGSFHDAHGRYRPGDIEEADGDVDHRPIAGLDEDCLCLIVIDAPLKLTSPIGRLINPFVKI